MVHPLKFLANLFNKKPLVHAGNKTKDQQSAPSSRVVPAMPCAYPNIYSDAVHFRLDGLLPYKTPHHEVLELLKNFRQKLTSNAYKPGTKVPTQFPGVKRVSENHYEVTLDNKQTETCTLAEAELHMLLVENQRYRESSGANVQRSKNTTPVPSAPLSHATASSPEPQQSGAGNGTQTILEYTDHLNNSLRCFNRDNINMQAVHAGIEQTHHTKGISAASTNCWWRAAMLSAIVQRKPEELERVVLQKLGNDFKEAAEALASMAAAVRTDGVNAILTNVESLELVDSLNMQSRLKLPGLSDSEGSERGEGFCQTIVHALLKQRGCDDDTLLGMIYGNTMGNSEHIAAVLRDLESDSLIFSTPWKENLAPGEQLSTDYGKALMTVSACDRSPLAEAFSGLSREGCTKSILQRSAAVPILTHRGVHFDLAIPKHYFR